MSDRSRIPTSPPKFNGYIHTTDDENVATNVITTTFWWTTFGLTSTNQTDWSTWRSTWDVLYPKYQNPATKTPIIVEAVHNLIRDFSAFARPLLNIMAASVYATEESEHIYRFVIAKNRLAPARRTSVITDACNPTVTSIGGGDFLIGCRNATDTGRASLAPGTDGTMVWYKVVITPPAVGSPIVIDNTWQSAPFSTARFVLDALEVNVGKWLLVATQWTYSPNAAFNGPVCAAQVVLIA